MTAFSDYGALRALALDADGPEEGVTVNQRSLVEKILARYSGEWTTLRELIQNAADAGATKVIIRYETNPSTSVAAPPAFDIRHVVRHHSLKRIVVTNDGKAFGPDDWARLKSIASGNPDEDKIGAFGVGFYSVFGETEAPVVFSGGEALAFYWKGNALMTRKMKVPERSLPADPSQTCFVLDLRESSPIPDLLSLGRFLATSLTFVGLQRIELWLDDVNVLTLVKKAALGVGVSIAGDIETQTKEGFMRVMSVQREMVQIDAKYSKIIGWKPPQPSILGATSAAASTDSLRGFFSRLTSANKPRQESAPRQETEPEDLSSLVLNRSIFLHIYTADIRPSITGNFAKELERATKKKPPRTTRVALLSPIYDASKSTVSVDVFSTILPKTSGKVFIGFPTAQTTGLLCHLSMPSSIPTVERESLDFQARWVMTWNAELMRAAGILCRIVWTAEMDSINKRFEEQSKGTSKDASVVALTPEAIQLFKQHTFQESTPLAKVKQLLEEAFWTSSKKASIDIWSSHGVQPSYRVRLPLPEELKFLQGSLPVIPPALETGAPEFIARLTEYGLLTEVTVSDIHQALENQTLDHSQVSAFLAYCAKGIRQGKLSLDAVRRLMEVAITTLEGDRYLALKNVKYFLSLSRIPANLPHPPETAPFSCTKSLPRADLEILGWHELQPTAWVKYLLESSGGKGLPTSQDMTASPTFSAQVLAVLSKCWDTLDPPSKNTIVKLLTANTIMPTKMGMKTPGESYFPTVKFFSELPVVSGLNGVKEKILVTLGVRKTLELDKIFALLSEDRSSSQTTKWSSVDLIKYLTSISKDLPAADVERLRQTQICQAESRTDPSKPSSEHYRASQLYEPKEALRTLELPLLHWPGVYRSGSPEARFLTSLGLQVNPTAMDLVQLMEKTPATGNADLHDRLMTFFITNYHVLGYAMTPTVKMTQRFLPIEGGDIKHLVPPTDCFVNEEAALFGFQTIKKSLRQHASKFGVNENPPFQACVRHLINSPPQSRSEARNKYAYLARRLRDAHNDILETLSNSLIVPVAVDEPGTTTSPSKRGQISRLQTPRTCFIGDGAGLGGIFDFVDFGSEANAFLLACGSKHSPSEVEIASLLAREPARILGTLDSAEKYLALLARLAASTSKLKQDKNLVRTLKNSRFLLASKDVAPAKDSKDAKSQRQDLEEEIIDPEEEPSLKVWSLAKAEDIIIVDEFRSYSLFKSHLLTAPQEELLEDFYQWLGSPPLSSLVVEEPRIGAPIENQHEAAKLRTLINERIRLLLHDYPKDGIRHDARWVNDNLHVRVVTTLSLRRSLRQLSVSEKTTAATTHTARPGWTLWITTNYDIFQVSQALVNLLLVRPKPHSTLTLELLLSRKLLELRARGYNVDRILRAKAAEARIAEDERQRQMVEERRLEQEQVTKPVDNHPTQITEKTPLPGPDPAMPGTFIESPPHNQQLDLATELSNASRKTKGIFSSVARRLGLEDASSGSRAPNGVAESKKQEQKPIITPQDVEKNLGKALQALRPHDSSSLFSRPTSKTVEECATYCDDTGGQDLALRGTTSSGINIFCGRSVSDPTFFIANKKPRLELFAKLLKDCAEIFNLPNLHCLHIFMDNGDTVAFNRRGSIFANFQFFQLLHFEAIDRQQRGVDGSGGTGAYGDALFYWYTILCHELAHNLVSTHSSAHSFWV
ncbi:MAG: hypothetical protein M1823_003691 [Watsoniomyces obsoletus]|nr:MAG: hypothetical protein M1823_003691 [Watsoniomyces obsoletus]